jgi:hypothetical protein
MKTKKDFSKLTRKAAKIMPGLLVIALLSVNAFAGGVPAVDTSKIDMLAGMFASIFQKIGFVVIFIGGLQIAFGIKSENPDTKSAGVKTAAAGALVAAIATSYNVFIS